MRRYDPRFLMVLGKARELHGIEFQGARKGLVAADVLLGKFLVENDESQTVFGLNDITLNAARQTLNYVKPLLEDQTFPDSQETFDAWKGLFLLALDHFESALSVDIEALPILLLEKKRGYSVDTLLKNIDEVLPEADRDGLSDFTRTNMQEAGACLAFHRFTACGYHIARAVEEVARRYYELIKGQSEKHSDGRHRMLGQIAEELQQVSDKQKNIGLLPLVVPTLRQFCRIYRNPLSHADLELKELGSNEAEVAFGHAVAAISTMIEDARNGGPYFSKLCIWN